ncbi:16S rRNA (guanine(966)-N(2))-methyltransferase RsmD [Roseateles amylovorans]|uniref:16S rRNA (Guanine(966)-N(2))-methyltransferase RsmD n=1 Tax=Roseateles amylovorans TaxID=2978473 RepID=A0ABY6AZZ5_9BURK|nr:16S rRNA (guanine(966)-N(2))-methyltransferase RsmD [Roseateles amylovorans]UXH77481.1 16S rRNA (guanine(966)-N(2))-methyltransferase RsmD [Roseateles amylovorans]
MSGTPPNRAKPGDRDGGGDRPRRGGRPGPRVTVGEGAVKPRPREAGPGEVRIVGGQWKRSKLPVPYSPGLRPTPDRVRETLFNWLGQDLSGWRVLDAFAGSGALGFEAASRGAAQITLLERDGALAAALRANLKRLDKDGTVSMRIENADALGWMKRAAPGSFDLIFLDPPFALDLFAASLRAAAPLIGEQGVIYLESPASPAPIELPPDLGLSLWREGRAGAVHYRLLRRSG